MSAPKICRMNIGPSPCVAFTRSGYVPRIRKIVFAPEKRRTSVPTRNNKPRTVFYPTGLRAGYFVSCASGNISVALSVGPTIVIPFLLFGGYFLNVGWVFFARFPLYAHWRCVSCLSLLRSPGRYRPISDGSAYSRGSSTRTKGCRSTSGRTSSPSNATGWTRRARVQVTPFWSRTVS